MPFEVIPALDVAGGRRVRIQRTGSITVGSFGGDPRKAAGAFVEAGARRLHLVDVELALAGEPGALDVLRAVAGLGVPVQASGGVGSAAQVRALLEAGASRVVLGSGPLGSRHATEDLLGRFGHALLVGIEADGGAIRPRGGGPEIPLWETVDWLGELEVPGYVFTQVGRVGSLGGPDLHGIRELASRTGRPVIASGGIRGIDDLRAVAGVGAPVQGAILGRALYEGLYLREVLSSSLDRGA
jgi:phosphoribosylformimino-5-aminoimidazole carboxamide ribonucleotide (ProFAR) isomerase